MKIENKQILLTGASGGIGQAIAKALSEQGAKLYLAGRNRKRLDTLAKELNIAGTSADASVIVSDITTVEGRDAIVKCVNNTDESLDLLINCAGTNIFGLFSALDDTEFEKMVATNLTAPVLLTKRLLPFFDKEKGGQIVNIGSTFGSIGYPGFVGYSATKFALRGFTEALRREIATSNIKVIYIAPRATKTRINTDAVCAMNKALGVVMDEPGKVASQVIRTIKHGSAKEYYIGWPERLFVKINTLIPKLVDNALTKQWPVIFHFATKVR